MKILSLKAKNFRNINNLEITPDKNINVFYGENAQGKTNILEALWMFTGAKSFRGTKDSELININGKSAELNVNFFSEEREQTAQIILQKVKKTAQLNKVQLRTPGLLVGHIGAVIFSPEHISLIKDGPQERRNFVDAALCQIKPSYVRLINRYRRILNQRNALLKEITYHKELIDTLPIWDERLIKDGNIISHEREEYIQMIIPQLKKIYNGISRGKEDIFVRYIKTEGEDFSQSLYKSRKQDLNLGYTALGPHRNDLEFELNGKSIKTFGSQGQKRSAVIALKLAEADILTKKTGENPIILLDDVLSELDSLRQDYVLNHLTDSQIFITGCEEEISEKLKYGSLFQVSQGKIINKDIIKS